MRGFDSAFNRRDLNGHGGLPPYILNVVLGDIMKGEKVVGRENILAAYEQSLKDAGVPKDVIAREKTSLAQSIDETGADPEKIAGFVGENGVAIVASKDESFDFESLANAARFSNRHDGMDAFGGFDLEGLFDRMRGTQHQRHEHDKNPVKNFFATVQRDAEARMAKKKTKEPKIVNAVLAASAIVAVEVQRFAVLQRSDDNPKVMLAAFGKMLDDLKSENPAKFHKLETYLRPYNVKLPVLCSQIQAYAENLRADQAEALVGDLSRLALGCINAMRDSAESAKTQAADAQNI